MMDNYILIVVYTCRKLVPIAIADPHSFSLQSLQWSLRRLKFSGEQEFAEILVRIPLYSYTVGGRNL